MTLARALQPFAPALVALAAVFTLTSCGSGAVGAPPSPINTSPVVTILPDNVVLYSGIPTTFVLSGGTGPYVVTSSNQVVVPSPGGVTGGIFTVVPNTVVADTTVTLSVRDTVGIAPVTAALTVRPSTINNSITITPNPLQSPSCSPGICSGGDADVAVTVSQAGIPIAGRGIRFEVLSGDFRFITTPPGTVPEQTSLTVNVLTDEAGVAHARIRVTALAPNQTALMQITDLTTGAFRRTTFVIAQFTGNNPAFFTLPTSVTFRGAFIGQCAASGDAIVSIFGGAPPYTITGGTSDIFTSRTFVEASGGQFAIQLRGNRQCIDNLPISVTDSTGRTIVVTVSNVEGTTTVPPIALFPETFALSCGSSSLLTISGGKPPFTVNSDHPKVSATILSSATLPEDQRRTVTVTRFAGDFPVTATFSTTVNISVTDGASGDISVGTISAAHCN